MSTKTRWQQLASKVTAQKNCNTQRLTVIYVSVCLLLLNTVGCLYLHHLCLPFTHTHTQTHRHTQHPCIFVRTFIDPQIVFQSWWDQLKCLYFASEMKILVLMMQITRTHLMCWYGRMESQRIWKEALTKEKKVKRFFCVCAVTQSRLKAPSHHMICAMWVMMTSPEGSFTTT